MTRSREWAPVLWASRAREELQATGETARQRDPSTAGQLTPQEPRVARLAAEGDSKRDIAAQLYLSPETVEYHLQEVFLKLDVHSRVELARMQLEGVFGSAFVGAEPVEAGANDACALVVFAGYRPTRRKRS